MFTTLEWQLCNIQMHAEDNNLQKNDAQQQASFPGLIVFTWEIPEDPHDDTAKLCAEQIIPVVQEKNGLPFILCLEKKVGAKDAGNGMALLNEAMRKLRADLKKTHLIFGTETPGGRFTLSRVLKK